MHAANTHARLGVGGLRARQLSRLGRDSGWCFCLLPMLWYAMSTYHLRVAVIPAVLPALSTSSRCQQYCTSTRRRSLHHAAHLRRHAGMLVCISGNHFAGSYFGMGARDAFWPRPTPPRDPQCDTAGNVVVGPAEGANYNAGAPPGAFQIDPTAGIRCGPPPSPSCMTDRALEAVLTDWMASA